MNQEVKFVQKKTGKVFLTMRLGLDDIPKNVQKLLEGAAKVLEFPDDVIPVSTSVRDRSDEIIERLERIEKALKEKGKHE